MNIDIAKKARLFSIGGRQLNITHKGLKAFSYGIHKYRIHAIHDKRFSPDDAFTQVYIIIKKSKEQIAKASRDKHERAAP